MSVKFDHKAHCSHPATKAARAACRKARRGAGVVEGVEVTSQFMPQVNLMKTSSGTVHAVRDDNKHATLCNNSSPKNATSLTGLAEDVTCRNCLKHVTA